MKNQCFSDLRGFGEDLSISIRLKNTKAKGEVLYMTFNMGETQILMTREQAEALVEMMENRLFEDKSYGELERECFKLQEENEELKDRVSDYEEEVEDRRYMRKF